MGVNGLWRVLAPCGRRVDVETLRGKVLAVDASIWLTQFIKAMRNKQDGRMLPNAHIVGSLRRILKLLHNKIKPLFVFDGGVPVLKKRIAEARRQKVDQNARILRKAAQKLLLNQLLSKQLREGIPSSNKDYDAVQGFVMPESNTPTKNSNSTTNLPDGMPAYVEQIRDESDENDEDDLPSGISWGASYQSEAVQSEEAAAKPKPKWGEVKKKTLLQQSTRVGGYVPKVESEDEDDLMDSAEKADEIIEQLPLLPNGDVDLSTIHVLPQRLQYEVIARLKDKRRQRESKRNEFIPVAANPQKYSALQLNHFLKDVVMKKKLDVMESQLASKAGDGKRIASDAKKHYVLIDTKEKSSPVNALPSSTSSSSSPSASSGGALGALDLSKTQMTRGKKSASSLLSTLNQASQSRLESTVGISSSTSSSSNNDKLVITFTKQEAEMLRITQQPQIHPDDEYEAHDTQKALETALNTAAKLTSWAALAVRNAVKKRQASNVAVATRPPKRRQVDVVLSEDDSEVQLSKPKPRAASMDSNHQPETISSSESEDELSKPKPRPLSRDEVRRRFVQTEESTIVRNHQLEIISSSESEDELSKPKPRPLSRDDVQRRFVQTEESTTVRNRQPETISSSESEDELSKPKPRPLSRDEVQRRFVQNDDESISKATKTVVDKGQISSVSMLQEPTPVQVIQVDMSPHKTMVTKNTKDTKDTKDRMDEDSYISCEEEEDVEAKDDNESFSSCREISQEAFGSETKEEEKEEVEEDAMEKKDSDSPVPNVAFELFNSDDEAEEEEDMEEKDGEEDLDEDVLALERKAETIDVTKEGLSEAEEKERRARIDEAQRDLIRQNAALVREKNLAQRDAETVTPMMLAEVKELLELFGLPYIESPMEAEAQCAQLEMEKIVDGVVTDDCDAFLFGAENVYKNIFDERKYVEAYKTSDIKNELGLDRTKLINMALLLGSDYTIGIKGIGVVNASEIVSTFPSLEAFRDWVNDPTETLGLSNKRGKRKKNKDSARKGKKRQRRSSSESHETASSQDGEESESEEDEPEAVRSFKISHRNAKKKWLVPDEFPSRQVIEAYQKPVVSHQVKLDWKRPDRTALRMYLANKLGWSPEETDRQVTIPLDEYESRSFQSTLDHFIVSYKDESRFAAIRSKRMQKAVKQLQKKEGAKQASKVRFVNSIGLEINGADNSSDKAKTATKKNKNKK